MQLLVVTIVHGITLLMMVVKQLVHTAMVTLQAEMLIVPERVPNANKILQQPNKMHSNRELHIFFMFMQSIVWEEETV